MANEQTMTITDFSPGLLTNPDARALPPGGAQVCRNVDTDRGDLRVRAGRVIAAGCPAHTTAGLRALQEFNVTGHDPEFRFVGVIGNRVYWSVTPATATQRQNGTAYAKGKMLRAGAGCVPAAAADYLYEVSCPGASGTTGVSQPTYPVVPGDSVPDGAVTLTCRATDMFDEINPQLTVDAANPVRIAQFGDKLYLVDGIGPVRQLDADGNLDALVEFLGPSVEPTVTAVTAPYVIDPCNMLTRTGSTAGDTQGAYHLESEGALNYKRPYLNEFNPVEAGVDWEDMQKIVCRLVKDPANRIQGQTQSVMLEVINDPDRNNESTPLTGKFYMVKQYARDDLDISKATEIMFKVKVLANPETPAPGEFYVCFGRGTDKNKWTTVQIDTTEWTTTNTEHEVVVSLQNVDVAERQNLGWFGFYWKSFEMKAAHRVERVSGVVDAGTEHGVSFIFGPITSNSGNPNFRPGTYEVTYTYYHPDEGESTEYQSDSLTMPYKTISINAVTPSGVSIVVTKDAGSMATEAYVYARGGPSAVCRRIGRIPLDGDPPYPLDPVWDGTYPIDAPELPEYVGRPPEGATMLTTWRNRMVYVGELLMPRWNPNTEYKVGEIIKPTASNGYEYCCTVPGNSHGTDEPGWPTTPGATYQELGSTLTWRCQALGARDVLYFSNFGDPTRVPVKPSALQIVPSTFGGWADLERWGHDVTGIAAYGPLLIAMKRQGIWGCQGDPGDTSFRIDEIDRREGCLSHESIVQAEGKLIWQARDKILLLDGAAIGDISLAVAPTVQGYADRQARAFGIADPQSRHVLWLYPGTEELASEALVLQLKTTSWTRYTDQPGSCGVYSQHAALPGVYLADGHGGAQSKLFRLAPGVTTDARHDGTAAAIDWEWVSGELPSLFPGLYAQIYQVRGQVLAADVVGPYSLLAGIFPNNDATLAFQKALTLTRLTHYGTLGTGVAQWVPPPRGEIESFALRLARASSDLIAVRTVSVTCLPRLLVRGRADRS